MSIGFAFIKNYFTGNSNDRPIAKYMDFTFFSFASIRFILEWIVIAVEKQSDNFKYSFPRIPSWISFKSIKCNFIYDHGYYI